MPFRFLKKMFGGDEQPAEKTTRPRQPKSFQERADEFWQWFASNEQRIFDDLQNHQLDAEELSARINLAAPMLAWELCPSPEDGKEGFALSGEGSASKRLLVNYLISRAPELACWTLFASKQAHEDVADAMVNIGADEDFAFSEFRFGIDYDTDEEQLEISVNHPRFSELPENARTQLTFIALDNALGENLIETWVGPIEHTPEHTPDQKYGIAELRRQARAALSLHDLDPDLDPMDRWIGYQIHETGDGDVTARADVFAGTTCNVEPVQGMRDPEYEDELDGSGACFVYVMVPRDDLTDGEEVDQRTHIEDTLGARLRDAEVGDFFGGAMGNQYAYIDLVLFDEPAAIEVIRATLAEVTFASRASLRYFSPQRRDEHVPLIG